MFSEYRRSVVQTELYDQKWRLIGPWGRRLPQEVARAVDAKKIYLRVNPSQPY